MPRPSSKTVVLTCRVTPEVKALLAAAADSERRSLANMLEVIVHEACERRSITSAEPQQAKLPSTANRRQ